MAGLAYALFRCCYPLAIYWWALWSRVYRFCVESRIERDKLVWHNLTPEDAQWYASRITWHPDTWRELGDAAGSPTQFQDKLNAVLAGRKQPAGSCDCDDFAGYLAYALKDGYRAQLLAVAWQLPGKWLPSGHVVCLYTDDTGRLRHIGNWGMSDPFARQTRQVAASIAGQAGGRLLGWSTFDKDVRVLTCQRA